MEGAHSDFPGKPIQYSTRPHLALITDMAGKSTSRSPRPAKVRSYTNLIDHSRLPHTPFLTAFGPLFVEPPLFDSFGYAPVSPRPMIHHIMPTARGIYILVAAAHVAAPVLHSFIIMIASPM